MIVSPAVLIDGAAGVVRANAAAIARRGGAPRKPVRGDHSRTTAITFSTTSSMLGLEK